MTASGIHNGMVRTRKLVFAAGEDSSIKDNLVVEPPTVTILVDPSNAGIRSVFPLALSQIPKIGSTPLILEMYNSHRVSEFV